MTLMPPTAPRHPVTREFHGRTFTDDYEWMRDKDAPETRAVRNSDDGSRNVTLTSRSRR